MCIRDRVYKEHLRLEHSIRQIVAFMSEEEAQGVEVDVVFVDDGSPDASAMIINTLDDGRFIDANDSFLDIVGYERDEVMGHTISELDIWPHPDKRDAFLSRVAAQGAAHNLEVAFRRKSGEIGVTLLSAEVVELDGQRCLLTIAKDMTERIQAAQERELLIQELDAFARTVAHDLKSPLSPILGYADLLLSDSGTLSDEARRSFVQIIADSASGYVMSTRKVDAVVVGCDRVAANGDAANKIGTYNLALAAKAHQVPFYVCGPASTIDLNTPSGAQSPVEEGPAEELTWFAGQPIAPAGSPAFNPAFDITPAELITAIITEGGVARPPFDWSLPKVVAGARKPPDLP